MGLFDSIVNSAKRSLKSNINSAVNRAVNEAGRELEKKASEALTDAMTLKTQEFSFAKLPGNVDELKALKEANMKDPYAVAALTILSLNVLAADRKSGFEMIEYLNGPSDVATRDVQFIEDRFRDGKDYVVRSYFKGAVPSNNYTPDEPYTVEVMKRAHSEDTLKEGYLKLFLHSGGADSDRYVVLRTKPSTGEWFLWEYAGLLAGIRIPDKEDAWA